MNSSAVLKTLRDDSRCTTTRALLALSGLQPLLEQPGITEIAINRPGEILVENSTGWQRIEAPACDLTTLMQLANAACIFNGNPISPQNPIQSVTLPDGQRAQFVMPPACTPQTLSLTIRRASSSRFSLDDYLASGRLQQFHDATLPSAHIVPLQPFETQMLQAKQARDMSSFFQLAIRHCLNIVLVGGTGSGKTTFTKALADLVPPATRIFTIEDTHELDLPHHPNRVHLFYGKGISPKQIVASCMRMKPDRVFLTELRGDEAYDYISLLNTGHPGSITTVHANDCRSALYRIGALIKQSGVGLTLDFDYIMREVQTTIDVVAFFKHTRMTELYYDPVRKFQLQRGAE